MVLINPPVSASNPVKVMIVDDSAIVRGFITRFIETDEEIKVVSSASNGKLALGNLERLDIDVIVLDIEMPVMDGLTALPLLFEIDPFVQVIVASTLTEKNAAITLKAMNSGANECMAKPSTKDLADADVFRNNLIQKVKALGQVARNRREANKLTGKGKGMPAGTGVVVAAKKKEFVLKERPNKITPDIIAIGSSTGGPQALMKLFDDLAKEDIKQPILITQHMPPTFTAILAANIAKNTGLNCKEAEDGEAVERGKIYMAKGGYHMKVQSSAGRKIIRLSEEAPENYCRPAVDPMIRSMVELYNNRVLAIILTGMGSDGLKACQYLSQQGGNVLAQDEATSVVWGMPGAVSMAGICSNVIPLGLMAKEIKKYAG